MVQREEQTLYAPYELQTVSVACDKERRSMVDEHTVYTVSVFTLLRTTRPDVY